MNKFTDEEIELALKLTKKLQEMAIHDIRMEGDFVVWGSTTAQIGRTVTNTSLTDFVFYETFDFNLLFIHKALQYVKEIDVNDIKFLHNFYMKGVVKILETNNVPFIQFTNPDYKNYIIDFDTKDILIKNIDKFNFEQLKNTQNENI